MQFDIIARLHSGYKKRAQVGRSIDIDYFISVTLETTLPSGAFPMIM